MDRVLALEDIELVGINNRDLGISLTSIIQSSTVQLQLKTWSLLLFSGTFKVDISNTKKLLEGERGERIRQRGIIVSISCDCFIPPNFLSSLRVLTFQCMRNLQVVGESGLFTPADIAYVQGAGVKAVCVA